MKRKKDKRRKEMKKIRKRSSVINTLKSPSPELPKPYEKSLDQITATADFMRQLKPEQKANA